MEWEGQERGVEKLLAFASAGNDAGIVKFYYFERGNISFKIAA